MAKANRFESLTQDDLYAKANEIREKMAALKAECRVYVEEIGRRDAEAALANRAGFGQTIGGAVDLTR